MTKFIKILPFVLAAGFAFFGAQKFGAENAVFQIIADRSGIDLFEPLIRRLTGAVELAIALLLVLPSIKTKALGALSGLGLLFGAIGFHLSPWLGINVPGIGHGLFITALILTALTAGYPRLIAPQIIAALPSKDGQIT